ncbi:SDR family oxidoreductase [bacterium]|nr:SDR family oxidoreductase [bacterium]
MTMRRSIFITGAGGYLGTELVRRLARSSSLFDITAFDVRLTPEDQRIENVDYRIGDVRDGSLRNAMKEAKPQIVVHLASIVNPGGPDKREFERSVDVGGTENVLAACIESEVRQLVVTSSGASYGYYADNPVPLHESDPLRGNPEFAYADHKRLIEERLAEYRRTHTELKQLVLRPGTILGERTDNQITRLFQGRAVVGIAGFETPFVFIWDEDVVEIIVRGIEGEKSGIYNLAGDGVVTLREIARITRKSYLPIPVPLFRLYLWLAQKLGLSAHGPDQIVFLQYRPVLANDRLKTEFGYVPRKTSREVFQFFWEHRLRRSDEF